MNDAQKILEDLLQGAVGSIKVTEINPPGSMVFGTLVKHMDDPKTFGFISEAYRTDKKDLDGADIFYYNVVWEGLRATKNDQGSYYHSPLMQKYTSVEPEHELISWHGNLLN
jgi:hypothetical protein